MKVNQLMNLMNRNVTELKAYHLKPDDVPIKLNQNECPFDWPLEIKQKVADYCLNRPWNRYPTFIPDKLKADLAGYTGLSPNNIIVGNGSNEMLLILLLALTNPHSPIVICQPTFTVYQLLARGLGRDPYPVTLNEDLTYNVKQLAGRLKDLKNPLLILSSPNNPTGNSLSEDQLRYLLDKYQGFLIFDQAYVEFGGYNAIPLLDEYPNLIITRTFSKALGAAGLRLGYMLGNQEIIANINKIKLPYNINFFSEYVAGLLVSQKTWLTKTCQFIIEQREQVYKFLTSLPCENIYPSEANFILIRTKRKDDLFGYLMEQGILVRDVSSYPLLENCLRINIGTEQENREFMNTCSDFFAKYGELSK